MKKLLFYFVFSSLNAFSQFAPPVGQTGSKAIFMDSLIIQKWATSCQVIRGWQNVNDTSLGKTTSGKEEFALQKADGQTISLGDGGTALLSFEYPIVNGNGADFVVFENAFDDTFLELALVEVSSDGKNFVRFPAISNTDTTTPIGTFGTLDATKIYNLAGKYRGQYGTPFDLEELKDNPLINVDSIIFVKLIDVVGSLDSMGKRDSKNQLINDPFPTPFPEGGFDLDALGLIHYLGMPNSVQIESLHQQNLFKAYPTIVYQGETIYLNKEAKLYNIVGEQLGIFFKELNTNILSKGVYILQSDFQTQKIIVK